MIRYLTVVLCLLALILGYPHRKYKRIDKLRRISIHSTASAAIAKILRSTSDSAFISCFGLDVFCFNYLLTHFEPLFDVSRIESGSLRLRPCLKSHRTVDGRICLALVLAFLRTCGEQRSLSLIFGTSPSRTSYYIRLGLAVLRRSISKSEYSKVHMPSKANMAIFSAVISTKYPALRGAFGMVDGLKLRVMEPGDSYDQNSYYNGWLCDTYISNLLVFVPDGAIVFAAVNFPGSWHDSRVAQLSGLQELLTKHCSDSEFIVGDSAFPLSKHIQRSSKCRDVVGKSPAKDAIFDSQLTSMRQCAEWGMRGFESAFPRLKSRLTNDLTFRRHLLETAVLLYNLRTRMVGLSQIATVWQDLLDSKSFME